MFEHEVKMMDELTTAAQLIASALGVNTDNARPASVSVRISADGSVYATATLKVSKYISNKYKGEDARALRG